MKPLLLFLLLSSYAICTAEESTAFGLSGSISINKAVMLMDGGSVSVDLKDIHGNVLTIFFRNNWTYVPSEYGGHFSLRFPKIEGRYVVRYRSEEERALLGLLHAACIKTFGTSDSSQLDERFKARRDWKAQALASLFRQANKRPERSDQREKTGNR